MEVPVLNEHTYAKEHTYSKEYRNLHLLVSY